MPRASATAQACWPAAPPNGTSVKRPASSRAAARARGSRGHLRHGDLHECFGESLDPVAGPAGGSHLRGDPGQPVSRGLRIERGVAAGTEHLREAVRPDAPSTTLQSVTVAGPPRR